MKLSFKFFAIAYSLLLLSTGFGGMVMLTHVTDTLWDTRVQNVERAEIYALDSFSAYAEMLPGSMTETQRRQISAQINASLDSAVSEIQIFRCHEDPASAAYADKEGAVSFEERDGSLWMQIECCVHTHTEQYIVRLYSDFTALREQCRGLWRGYGMTILALSVTGGIATLLLTKTITRPLRMLSVSARQIAQGDYGVRVSDRGRDAEIAELSASFNHMASTVETTIRAITEEAEKRERFTADFAHEMKTPMTAIIGYSQMLCRYDLTASEQRAAAQAIHKESTRLEKLSLQMLEWSLYQRDEAELVPTSMEEIAAALSDTMHVLSERSRTPFSIELGGAVVYADRVSLCSLLYNLADNAFKAQGTAVRVWSVEDDDRVTVFVKDHGRGIAPENLEKLTEPFYREDRSRSRALGGVGLGLSISRRIAAIHGTSLHFDSELGAGTVVSFHLRKVGESDG